MPEALEVLDQIQSGQTFSDVVGGEVGHPIVSKRRQRSPRYRAQLAEAARLTAAVYKGNRRATLLFQEAMSTSHFPLLFGDILDRQLLAGFNDWVSPWREFLSVGTVRDFRAVKRFTVDGGQAVLPEVGQGEEYEARSVDESSYGYQVYKYGARMAFNWETLINDDLNALRDAPVRLGKAARRTVDRFATSLYAGASGPDTTMFRAALGNIITSNPVLGVAGLEAGMRQLANLRDPDGFPILLTALHLVVPPALAVTASNLLNATQIEMTNMGGDSNQKLITSNWMRNILKLHVDPFLPIVTTTNGNTSWYLFADQSVGRPVAEVAFLSGHESPELWMKSPNAMRVGGGEVNPLDGDFDTDSIQYRVRYVFGGGQLLPADDTFPPTAVASNGTAT